MQGYLTFCRRLNKAAMAVSVLFLFATVVICLLQVTTRTLMSFSFRWTEELTRYIVIFAVFFASGTLLAEDEHPRVEMLCALLPKKTQLRLNYFYYALITAFVALLAYYGWQLAASSTRTFCSSIRIPWAIPFSAVFAGGVNMLLQMPAKFIKNHIAIRELADGEEGGEGE